MQRFECRGSPELQLVLRVASVLAGVDFGDDRVDKFRLGGRVDQRTFTRGTTQRRNDLGLILFNIGLTLPADRERQQIAARCLIRFHIRNRHEEAIGAVYQREGDWQID